MDARAKEVEVFDNRGQPQRLGIQIAAGGEGAVFALADRHDVVAKRFHPDLLRRRGIELQRKIEFMAGRRAAFATLPVSWPSIPIYDDSGAWIGFAMKRASGVSLAKLVHPMLGPKYAPNLERAQLVAMLLDLLQAVGRLHAEGVRIGDVNLNNFLFDPDTGSVRLIDCDSFQVAGEGVLFRCLVGTADMVPPEHQSMDFARLFRTPESDLFSLAMLMFKCFMASRHPYDSVDGGGVEENLRNGHFPYGIGGAAPGRAGAIPAGPWYVIWSHLTFELKSLFIQTLGEGARNLARRATIAQWVSALEKYAYALRNGAELALLPRTVKSRKYRGKRSDVGVATASAIVH